MGKIGKIARFCQWKRGSKFKSGKKRGEKVIDFVYAGGYLFFCRMSHRATFKTHPLKARGKHYWQLTCPQPITFISEPILAEKQDFE